MTHPAFHAPMSLLEVNHRRLALHRQIAETGGYDAAKLLEEENDALDCRLVSSIPTSNDDLKGALAYLRYRILCNVGLSDDLEVKDMEQLKIIDNAMLYLNNQKVQPVSDPAVIICGEWKQAYNAYNNDISPRAADEWETLSTGEKKQRTRSLGDYCSKEQKEGWEEIKRLEEKLAKITATTPAGIEAQLEYLEMLAANDEIGEEGVKEVCMLIKAGLANLQPKT